MKKLTFLVMIAIVTMVFNANAQIEQGSVLVGSDFASLSFGLDNPHVIDINVSPKAAWFIQDGIALGGYVNLGVQTANGSNTVFNYGFGALGRYYAGADALTVLKHGRVFGEATVGIGGQNVSNGGGNTNGLNLSVGPGFAYFVTKNIGLETLLKYNGLIGFGSETYQSTLGLTFGLQIYLPGQATAKKISGDMK